MANAAELDETWWQRHASDIQLLCELAFVGKPLRGCEETLEVLESRGWLARAGGQTKLADVERLAKTLAANTKWGNAHTIWLGPQREPVATLATELSAVAKKQELEIAITGRVGAAQLGILGTGAPRMRVWVNATKNDALDTFGELGLEQVGEHEATIGVNLDKWGYGTSRRRAVVGPFGVQAVTVAHPIRIWCDLHSELRGQDFAEHLWSVLPESL